MPRKPIDLPYKIEHISIVDDEGNIDKALEPKLSGDELKTMYRYMLMGRRTDERMLLLQRQGRIGTFPQSSGHEAISMGSVFAIGKNDWHVPAYRELAGMLYRGWPLEVILLYWNGYEEGASPPEGVNDLPYCVPVASQLLHAAGIGMAMNIKKEKNVCMTYFGDGSASEGDFHEALNFASVFAAPVIFVCQNNQYAISVPLHKQMKAETIAQRSIAYGMPGVRVDGNDILSVYVAAKEAVDRARSGGGPTLIEGLTYRVTPHTTADDPKRYRKEDEVEPWTKRDCIARMTHYMLKRAVMSEAEIKSLEEEVDTTIKAAVKRFEELGATPELQDPLAMFDYLYADTPQFLQEQRDELARYLGKGKGSESKQPQASRRGG